MIVLSIPRRLRGPTRPDSIRNPNDELANRTFDTTGGRVPAGGVLSVDGSNRHPRPQRLHGRSLRGTIWSGAVKPASRFLPSIALRTINSTTVRGLVFYCGSSTARNFQKRLASTLVLVQGGVWQIPICARSTRSDQSNNRRRRCATTTTTSRLARRRPTCSGWPRTSNERQRRRLLSRSGLRRKLTFSAREQRLEQMLAKHHNNALLVCDKCDATFQRQTWLNKHKQANCGRHLK